MKVAIWKRPMSVAAVVGVCLSLTAGAFAGSPEGMRLYVFSSGWGHPDKSMMQSGAAPAKIAVPVAFFLIKHPKGNVLFDSGNNDRIITDPSWLRSSISATRSSTRSGRSRAMAWATSPAISRCCATT